VSETQTSNEYGTRLLALIRAAGYATPTALARDAGISPSVLIRATQDESLPAMKTLNTIAPFLNMPASELVIRLYEAPRDLGEPLDVLLAEAHKMLDPGSALSEDQRTQLRQLLNAVLTGFRPTVAKARRDAKEKAGR
jgi:transcriptional regulator with XRE-family HTH domain